MESQRQQSSANVGKSQRGKAARQHLALCILNFALFTWPLGPSHAPCRPTRGKDAHAPAILNSPPASPRSYRHMRKSTTRAFAHLVAADRQPHFLSDPLEHLGVR